MSDNDNPKITDNVIPMRGGISACAFGEPVPEIVSLLEEALEDARAGRVRCLAIAYSFEDGSPGQPQSKTSWHHETCYFPHLFLAASTVMEQLKNRLD
jgi:hypothetical protein